MRRKVLAWLLTLSMVFTMMPYSAFATDAVDGGSGKAADPVAIENAVAPVAENTDSEEVQKVAGLNGVEYEKLQDAIKDAKAGDTITLLADVNENVTISQNITIDGDEREYTGKITMNSGKGGTIQNVKFVKGNVHINNTNTAGTYSIKGCTFNGENAVNHAIQAARATALTVENCTVENYIYSFLYVNLTVSTVTVTNVDVENVNYASRIVNGSTVSIDDLKVKEAVYGLVLDTNGTKNITVKNSGFENVTNPIFVNGTAKTDDLVFDGVNDLGTDDLSFQSAFKSLNAEAQNGNKIGSLEAIAEDAQKGETITLLKDTDAELALPEGVGLDYNGFKAENITVTKGLDGSGTAEDPYLINTAEDLYTFAEKVNDGSYKKANVVLNDNIDLGGEIWTPIDMFSGTFDGNDKVIKNFKIDATTSHAGFFNVLEWANVYDLTLSDVEATVGKYRYGTLARSINQTNVNKIAVKNVKVTTTNSEAFVAGLVCHGTVNSDKIMNNCTVENLTVDAQKGAMIIAGIVTFVQKNGTEAEGANIFDNLKVKNFKVTASDSDGYCNIGGLFGQTQSVWQNPKLINCEVTGIDVTATGTVDVGGMICYPGSYTFAENCTTEGEIDVTGVTGEEYFAGGFLGDAGWGDNNGKGDHKFTNCSANVDIITKVASAGGFIGSVTNSESKNKQANFVNCVAEGSVTCVDGGTASVGGFAGNADRGTYTDCLATGDVVNNGTGYAGQFIGSAVKGYAITVNDSVYDGTSSALNFIGNRATDADVTVKNSAASINGEKYGSLQDAVDACVEGENTIKLLADCSEDIKVVQKDGVNITIDGASETATFSAEGNAKYSYSGTFTVNGDNRYDGEETLTFTNIAFSTDEKEHYFIDANEATEYAHNITVENCTFTATGEAVKSAAGIRVRQGNDIDVKDVTATDLHSLIQLYGCKDVIVDNATINNCKNGISVGTSTNVEIKECDISVAGYGIRADGNDKSDMIVDSCTINAEQPVVVRKAKGEYALTVKGECALTAADAENPLITFTAGDDGEALVEPSGKFSIDLSESNIARSQVYPFHPVADVDGVEYESLYEALEKAPAGKTVRILADINLDNTITIPADKTVTLDLNGYTISQAKECTASYEMINNKGNLTIVDGSSPSTGKISFKDTSAGDPNFGWGSYTIRNEGTLVVEGGTIEHLGEQAFATHMICAIFQYSGSTTIKGGTISTPNYRSMRLWKGEMTIEGGDFEGQVWVQCVDDTAKLTIEGGTFKPVGNDGSSVFVENNAKAVEVSVTGGFFETKIGCSDATKEGIAGAITGGTFTASAKENTNSGLIAEGFIFEENAEGNFGVVEDPTYNKVAQVGDTYYATLQEAIEAAEAGASVTLIADVTTDTKITIAKSVVIDGDGYTLTYTGSDRAIDVPNTAVQGIEVEIKDLTVDCTASYCQRGINFNQKGTLVLEKVTVGGENVTYALNLPGSADEATVEITKSNLTGNIALNVWGEDCTITANRTTFTSVDKAETENYAAINLNNDGTTVAERTVITITGGEIVALDEKGEPSTAVSNATVNGKVNISAITKVTGNVATPVAIVTYENTDNFYSSFSLQGAINQAVKDASNGTKSTVKLMADIEATEVITIKGDVTIEGNGYSVTSNATRVFRVTASDADVTINGLDIISSAVRVGTNDVRGISIDSGLSNINLTLNDCSVDFTDASANDWAYAVNVSGKGTGHEVTVNGGTYEGANVINAHGADNKITVKDATLNCLYPDNDMYAGSCIWVLPDQGSKVEATGNTFNGENAVAFNLGEGTALTESDNTDNTTVKVAKIGDTYYTSLEEAIDAAKEGDTITMLYAYVVETGETLTLDKAVTIEYTSNAAGKDMFTNRGTMVVDGATLVYVNTDTTASNVTVSTISCEPGSVLEVKSGVVKNDSANNGAKGIYAYAIDLLTNGSLGDVTATISGGEVISTNYMAIRQFNNGTACKNILNVTGGKIYAATRAIQVHIKNNAAYTTISGGEIEGGDYALCLFPTDGNNISVTGGKFTGTVYSGTDGIISGGSFDVKPYEGYVAEGYAVKENNDGTYGVYKPAYVAQVGEDVYETLAVAIAAATAGDTIILLDDVTEDVTIDKNLTIDGADKQYTGTMTVGTGLTVVVNNVNFVKGCISEAEGKNGTLTVTNCTFNGVDRTINYAITMRGGNKLTVTGCTAKEYRYGLVYTPNAVATVAIDTVEVSNCTAAFNISRSNDSTLNNVKVENVTYGLHVQNYGARTYSLTNCELNADYPIYVQKKGTATVTFKFEGANVAENLATGALNGYGILELNADATLTAPEGLTVTTEVADSEVVYNDGVYSVARIKDYVAQVGEEQFESLQAAFEAAQAGDTIKVLKDITLTDEDMVKVDGKYDVMLACDEQNITLDLNGKVINVDYNGGQYLYAVVFVADGAELTVIDSSEELTGKIDVPENGINVAYMFWKRGETGSLTIENGTYHMDDSADSMVYTNGSEIVTVNGGTFILDAVGTRPNEFPCIFSAAGKNTANIIVNGGTYNYDINHQYWIHEVQLPAERACKDNGDGTWTVVDAAAYIKEVHDGYGHDVGYATLQEAIDAAKAGETVTVVKDIVLDAPVTVAKEMTLDLNGKAVSYTTDVAGEAMITNSGNLTITDSTENAEGKISFAYTGAADSAYSKGNYTVVNTGTLTLENGTVENATAKMSHAYYTIQNSNDGTFVINGGKVVNETGYAIRQFASGSNTNTVTINGGEVSGTRAVWMQAAGSNASNAPTITLDVKGGKLVGTGEDNYKLAVYSYSYGDSLENVAINVENGTIEGDIALTGGKNKTVAESVTITGGNFDGAVYSYAEDDVAGDTINISGGTFTSPVEEVYCASGYIPADNGDGTYGVKQGTYVAQINGVNYEDLQVALDTAKANEDTGKKEVKLIADFAVDANAVVVPSGVTLDLNGKYVTAKNVLAFGTVIDTATNVGGIVISNNTADAFVQLQPDNAGYLPIYDTTKGCYRFYAVEVIAAGVRAPSDSNALTFGFKLRFANTEAYNVIVNSDDIELDYVVDLSWTGLPGSIEYTMKSVKTYAAGYTPTLGMELYVSGLNKLDAGSVITATPHVSSTTGVVIKEMNLKTLSYEVK